MQKPQFILFLLCWFTTVNFAYCQSPKNEAVRIYLSKVNTSNTGMEKALEKQTDIIFSWDNKNSTLPIIDINPGNLYQEMDGFGASFTEASAYLIHEKLTLTNREKVLLDLFSKDKGIGISMLRQPIGASDHVLAPYTFDDVNFLDTTLSHFNISHDTLFKIPVIKQAISIVPGRIKISCATWSPPAWMKQNNSILGKSNNIIGRLRPDCYNAYANYIVRFIDEYEKRGIPIYATSMQNEPDHASDIWPAMKMSSEEQANLIKNYLGPKLENKNVKIWCWDHNFNTDQYPDGLFVKNIFNDASVSKYVAGSAWHWYSDGFPKVLNTINNLYPNKEIHFTEGSGGEWNPVKKWHDGFMELMRYMVNLPRASCKSIVLWNIALNEQNGPDYYYRQAGSQSTCRGLITINQNTGQVIYNADYYAMGHLSKFVDPGARRIYTNQWDGEIENVAFKNPDGSVVLVACNRTKESRTFQVSCNGKKFDYTLTPETAATFVWENKIGNSDQ
jgi:glucosylceramidase